MYRWIKYKELHSWISKNNVTACTIQHDDFISAVHITLAWIVYTHRDLMSYIVFIDFWIINMYEI